MLEAAFTCQQCKARLRVTEGEGLRLSGSGSGLSTRLEESFLLLGGADESGSAARSSQQQAPSGSGNSADGNAAGTAGRRLEESFVVLQGAVGGVGRGLTAPAHSLVEGGASGVQRMPFDAKLRALARVWDVAAEECGVELPLCAECAAEVHREMEAQLGDLQREVAAYETALGQLGGEGTRPLDGAAFQHELQRTQQEVERERRELEAVECQLAAASSGLEAVEAAARQLSSQEARYWAAFHDHAARLRDHLDERDALQHRLEASGAALAVLKRASVYHDAFRIWFDGACGTISGLRLGRTAQQAVEWDEINAAWGQAVLLLATLAKACGVTFRSHRLLPRGSYPRVAEARPGGAAWDLHGPVSKFLCASYDKAQVGFLACLREFADWLVARGVVDAQGAPFALPCAIRGDCVAGLTIRLMFNKDKSWTRALKHMLVDLKFVLKYALVAMDARTTHRPGAPTHPVATLQREDFAGAGAPPAGRPWVGAERPPQHAAVNR